MAGELALARTRVDLLLDGEFGFVGELVAVGAEDLDAVVLPGIVAGGDDDAGGEAVLAGKVGDGRGGDDAGGFDGGAGGGEGGDEGGGDPGAGFPGVHTEDEAGLMAEVAGEGNADGTDGVLVQRSFARDGANSVCSEQLPHPGPFCCFAAVGGGSPPHPPGGGASL